MLFINRKILETTYMSINKETIKYSTPIEQNAMQTTKFHSTKIIDMKLPLQYS